MLDNSIIERGESVFLTVLKIPSGFLNTLVYCKAILKNIVAYGDVTDWVSNPCLQSDHCKPF